MSKNIYRPFMELMIRSPKYRITFAPFAEVYIENGISLIRLPFWVYRDNFTAYNEELFPVSIGYDNATIQVTKPYRKKHTAECIDYIGEELEKCLEKAASDCLYSVRKTELIIDSVKWNRAMRLFVNGNDICHNKHIAVFDEKYINALENIFPDHFQWYAGIDSNKPVLMGNDKTNHIGILCPIRNECIAEGIKTALLQIY